MRKLKRPEIYISNNNVLRIFYPNKLCEFLMLDEGFPEEWIFSSGKCRNNIFHPENKCFLKEKLKFISYI